MSDELVRQRDYWNREISLFEAIYSRKKSGFSQWLDRVFRKDMYERFSYTLRQAEPIKDREILDVGCGTGRYAFAFIERGCRKVTGIDIAGQMIDHCRKVAVEKGVTENAEFTCTDLLDFHPGKKFDICIGIGLFDYISDPLPVLKKMRECTGDSLIVSFPRLWTWRAPVRKIRLGLRGCNVRFFTKKQISALLTAAGFSRISMEKVGKLYCVTAR
jgi:SAM-dependent methyltransferase